MSMPLPMKLRTRLFLSISALITVSLFGLLLGLFSVMQLGRAQEQRMSHHHATIEVSQQLRQLLGDQLVILLREKPDGQALERSQNDFRRVLEQGRANTVDGAEQAALDGVRDAYLQLQAHTPALLKAPMADNDGFSEAFNTLRLRLQDLQQLALAGISDAETSARHRAYLVAGLLGLVGVAILLIGFVTAHSIARRFGAPIETLARAADRIGEGDFDVTLPMTNVAEVGQLTRRFGLMAEALRQYRKTSVEEVLSGERRLQAVLDSIDDGLVIFDNQGRIEHANPVAIRQLFVSNDPHGKRIDEILSDVDVQEAVEKALLGEVQDEAMPDLVVDVAGESRLLAWSLYPVTHPGGHSVGAVLVVRDVTEQRAFERVRSEFVLRASHELRTPVTGMQMAFSLLRERLDFPAESREADLIQTVDEEMSRLVLLINDLLNFSRYQTGMQKLELASCDLVDLLTQAQQRFTPKGEARRVSLQLELGDELPRLQLDRLQIERVIDNLLENALRHSSEGGQIHLQARRQGDRVLIAVEDNGEGIPSASKDGSSSLSSRSDARRAAPASAWRCARKSSSCMAGASRCARNRARARASTCCCRCDRGRSRQAFPQASGSRHRQQQGGGFQVRLAIEAGRTVFHLESADDVAGVLLQLAGLRHQVTVPRQLLLEPAHIRQLAVQFGEPARQFAGLRPGHQAGVGEALPGEQRTWIDLAARRDIAVSDDPVRGDAVALGDVLQQGDQRLDLRFAERIPDPPLGCIAIALVDDLDADRGGVQPGPALPFTDPGVPGAAVLIHQAVDGGRLVVADQVVRADATVGEDAQRMRQIGGGVVEDDELDTAVLVRRGVVGIQARAAGAAGQQRQGESQ